MDFHELHNNVKMEKGCVAQSITATLLGAIIDRQGFNALEFIAHLGANANFSGVNYIEMKIEHGDDSGLSDAAYPDANDVIVQSGFTYAAGVWALIDDTAEDDAVYKVGYIGLKRYVRISFVITGTLTGGVPVGAVAALGRASDLPVSDA